MQRAIQVSQYGGPEELKVVENLPIPTPKPTEVLVEVYCSGVNPIDTYIRSGIHPSQPKLPYTPGKDAAGVVKSVGHDVTRFKAGDRVFLCSMDNGTMAEYVTVPEHYVFHLYETVSFAEGAGLIVPYFTAYRSLYILARGKPGMKVLVHGASGGCGQAVVQLGRAGGMEVVGTAGTEEGMQLVKEMGADAVYCHKDQDYLKKMSTNEKGFDIIVEMLSNINLDKDLELLRPRGTVVVVGCRGTVEINPRLLMFKETTVVGCMLAVSTTEEWIETGHAIQSAIKKGDIKPRVSKRYPLEQAGTAHYDIMSGVPTLGKLVVDVKRAS